MTEDAYDFQEAEEKEEASRSTIRINDRYGIGILSDQYTLFKIGKNKKTGKDRYQIWKAAGRFKSMGEMCGQGWFRLWQGDLPSRGKEAD